MWDNKETFTGMLLRAHKCQSNQKPLCHVKDANIAHVLASGSLFSSCADVSCLGLQIHAKRRLETTAGVDYFTHKQPSPE